VLTTLGLVGHIAMDAGMGVTINFTLAFFEEVGWRTWMLPRLVDRSVVVLKLLSGHRGPTAT
jgi:membrane protease YdiL (CAAX protease family)